MRTRFIEQLRELESDELLSTGEASLLLGVSRQHIVDLVDRGDLPAVMVGAHRRVRKSDLERVRTGSRRSTRDQRRSRWLGFAVAGRIVEDPERLLTDARNSLSTGMERRRSNKWDAQWSTLLAGPIERVLEALTADTVRSRELRQNSPFVLPPHERERVLDSFARSSRQGSHEEI